MDINVLGPVEVRAGDQTVDVGSRRHRQVLAALLVDTGTVVSVDTLVERVWGDAGASAGSVHAIVSRLRARLGDAVIVTHAPGYRLDLAGHRLDAEVFARRLTEARGEPDAALARTAVREALGLWRGRAYADIELPFAEAESERLERLRLSAHELLAELDLRLGRHADVLEWLPDLVRQHPLQESLRALLMLGLYRAGRQADALATYEDARRALAEELGIDPGPELRRLHERVLRQDRSLTLPAASPAAPERPRRTPLVGREEQLAEIDRAVARGLAGEPTVVAVTGEAGIGKTRLVEEAVAHASGATVGFGRCWDHDGAPAFWPWEQALSDLVAAVGVELARAAASGRAEPVALLVPALGPAPTVPGTASVARARLYDAVAAFVETLAAQRPVVLALEDFHWADQESVELLEYVVTTVRSGRLVIVVTVRDPSELAATAGDDVVAALARRPGGVRLELTGLTVPAVRELVAGRTGVEVSLDVAHGLRERTEGNPFYVSELALLYGEERRRSGAAGIPVPTSVRAVIERRLRHLSGEDVDVLVAAAVVGRTFDLPLLAEVTGRSRLELVEVLDRGVAAGVLDEHGVGAEQRFTHALVQETLVLSVGPMRRATLHAQIARALDARHGADGAHAAAIAHHYAAAGPVGDVVRGVELSIAAASSAATRFALGEAERNLRQALALVASAPAAEAKLLELELRVRLGSLLTLRYGYNGAGVAEERRRALALAADTDSSGHLLSALWGTWGNALVSGRFDEAESVIEQIEQAVAVTGDADLRLALHVARGQTAWHRGHLAAARADLERAVVLAEEAGDALDLEVWLQHPGVQARGWLAVVLGMLGEIEESDTVAAGTDELVEKVGHPFSAAYADILEGLRTIWLERPEKALELGDRGIRDSERQGFAQARAFALLPAGWARGRLG
ncbi:MAG TPA: BTAD domain-containing putative transcriptional regulator, partial [Nocardioides sp.]|uniref:BTAD domain-containing putative transcriptional regulator n=1 Tax=Nocardioides sp. TaxID=35761 RepID=UPI002ED8FC28